MSGSATSSRQPRAASSLSAYQAAPAAAGMGAPAQNVIQNPPPNPSGQTVQEIADIDESEIAVFMQALTANILGEFEAILSSVRYLGFEPVAFRAMLIKHLKDSGRDNAAAAKIIKQALALVVMRGTKLRSMDKMKEEGRQLVRELASVGVSLNPPKGSMAPNVITLQRIAAAFAVEVSTMLGTRKARIVGDAPAGFPQSLCHPNAVSFFPTSVYADPDSPLMAGMQAWRASFSEIVNVGENKMNADQLRVNIERFTDIVFNSRLYAQSARMGTLASILRAEHDSLPIPARGLFLTHVDQSVRRAMGV